ncbi:hypothetical protein SCATT_p11560 (plasmid) [Streptantibioticus cattleyicolor NRRL 8057 = DSM 46488]|uniref:N-acetyltransferase domain-containing protein n=1 Tax=Streptantibioticus cattleyicolor (strain ATCC 35852 / DSM 46488 / JCM 4925 / NBRC 14057 / NRRL 8057) TaxID=1003195 RepID=G8XES6_STREN|nr:hypothetical protein SCATT_p11560 [Streptantibioticus cattleyicolor NRRL 8057 = DSM 46488]
MRHIQDADWPAIVALEAGAYTRHGLSEGRAALQSRVRASPRTCFVLDHHDRVAGYLLALPYPPFRVPDLARTEGSAARHHGNLHLHDVVVAEPLRGRGLGGHLLRHLTTTAAPAGYRRLSLVAVAGSGTYWAGHGFTAHPGVELPDSYGTDAVYMSRPWRAVEPPARSSARSAEPTPPGGPGHRPPSEYEVG